MSSQPHLSCNEKIKEIVKAKNVFCQILLFNFDKRNINLDLFRIIFVLLFKINFPWMNENFMKE